MLENQIEQIRKNNPLVHNITNAVSIYDVANIELAIGASPIMAEAKEEVEEITSLAQSLNVNMGMLNLEKFQAIKLATKKAQACKHPIVLDVVGVGASSFRKEKVFEILNEVQVSVIKGNRSEIKSLSANTFSHGVDVEVQDRNASLGDFVEIAKKVAKKYQCTVVMTGKQDVISDGKRTYIVKNGQEKMQEVTGTGCQLSGLIASFITNENDLIESCVGAVCTMGLAGQKAFEQLLPNQGNATYGQMIIDQINLMDSKQLFEGAIYEKYQG